MAVAGVLHECGDDQRDVVGQLGRHRVGGMQQIEERLLVVAVGLQQVVVGHHGVHPVVLEVALGRHPHDPDRVGAHRSSPRLATEGQHDGARRDPGRARHAG
ncbi:MAG TPA: hypothetical protein VGE77_09335 [Nocardioides sp.]